MILKLQELLPITSINFQPDLTNLITGDTDLLALENITVDGEAYYDNVVLTLNVVIKADITQACSITLKPVIYPVEISSQLFFGNDEDSDYPLENELDLLPFIYAELYAAKQYRVFHETADHSLYEETEKVQKPFANLEAILKKD